MPARKRKRSTTRSSSRPKKRRRTNSNNTTNTNASQQRRSARLQARNARKEDRIISDEPNNDNHNSNHNIPERRRSSRIALKVREQEKSRQEYEMKLMDVDDITESIQEIEVSLTPNRENKNRKMLNIYKPLSPPLQRPIQLSQSYNDYMTLRNRMELGQISAAYFRETIFDNELNDFWDHCIKQNKYSITSISSVFNGVASTDKKINAFTLHDSELFSFSGTKDGFVGITNFSQLQFPYPTIAVKVHGGKVTDIRTCSRRPLHLYTSGFDGRVKVLDLSRIPTFQSIQNDENELQYFNDNNQYFGDDVIENRGVVIHGVDIKNGGREVYAVDNDGMLLCCDLRTHQNRIYPIAEKKVATIRISPFNSNYFVTTENKRKLLQCWDFRMIHGEKGCNNNNNLQCVHFRKFSKTQKNINFSDDGSRLLTCGRDDFIRVYEDPLNTFYQHNMQMKHWNNTGIWICDFKPVFHPKYPQIITTGNMERKGVDVLYFGKNGKMKQHNINDMSKVRSVHTFGQFHSRYDEFLFGVTYDKIVRFSNIDLNEEIHDDDDMHIE